MYTLLARTCTPLSHRSRAAPTLNPCFHVLCVLSLCHHQAPPLTREGMWVYAQAMQQAVAERLEQRRREALGSDDEADVSWRAQHEEEEEDPSRPKTPPMAGALRTRGAWELCDHSPERRTLLTFPRQRVGRAKNMISQSRQGSIDQSSAAHPHQE